MRLYVGNLAFATTNDELKAAFEAFGAVESATVIMDRETGRSKGFGFVDMGNDEEAKAAIAGLDGQPIGGRNVRVNIGRAGPLMLQRYLTSGTTRAVTTVT